MYYVKDKYRNRTWNRYVSKWNWVVPFPRHRDELLCVSSATSRLISHESIRNRLTSVKRVVKHYIFRKGIYIYSMIWIIFRQKMDGFFSFSSQLNLSPRLSKTYWITSKDNFNFLLSVPYIFNFSFFHFFFLLFIFYR